MEIIKVLPSLSVKELKDIRSKQKEYLKTNKVKVYGTSFDKYKLVRRSHNDILDDNK